MSLNFGQFPFASLINYGQLCGSLIGIGVTRKTKTKSNEKTLKDIQRIISTENDIINQKKKNKKSLHIISPYLFASISFGEKPRLRKIYKS